MKIKELKQGDRITQHIDQSPVSFEVLAIQQLGRRFMVTFRSAFGIETAEYSGEAYVTAG
ncbi:hypothetical protein [Chromobacterium sp. IIBBL 290-4]|uniref:hypothetical protein n=1 Tax=Chromobacterium sp. IIBBL 290-4 TaxID=2953890 RepID=UPI0020B7DC1D|nr:hypothetical protein [Chromobacterium sp. IIBBL 290-4]UTH76223.1 hypothetical protein NKT35_09025 [Chromobacterium sp. IIBBL 290-4]